MKTKISLGINTRKFVKKTGHKNIIFDEIGINELIELLIKKNIISIKDLNAYGYRRREDYNGKKR